MSEIAIQVEGLGKLYQLAHAGAVPNSLRDALTAAFLAPFRRFKELSGTSDTLEPFWALRDASFKVERGEVLGVVGRNGAGKSTLLKILSRIVDPTEGRVVMRGRTASLLEVGTGFHPELTGRENVYLNGAILGMRRREIDAKFDEIVDFAEVERFLDTPVKRYSSGMYVRLAFAVAAHLDPDVLIVDEVLAVGDAQFQKKCIGKMKSIAGRGSRTVIFVSHNMGALRSLCSSGILMRRGRVELQGSVDAVIREYLRPEAGATKARQIESSYGITLFEAGIYADDGSDALGIVHFLGACQIRIRIGAKNGFEQAALVVRVHDELGNLVSSLNSYEEGVPVFRMEDSHVFVYPIEQMRLMPGRYAVSIYVHRPHDGTRYLEADSYFAFEVVPALVPGGMLPYTESHGTARFVDGCRVETG